MDMPLLYMGPPQTIPDQLGPGPLGYQQTMEMAKNDRIVNYNQPYKNLMLQGPISDLQMMPGSQPMTQQPVGVFKKPIPQQPIPRQPIGKKIIVMNNTKFRSTSLKGPFTFIDTGTGVNKNNRILEGVTSKGPGFNIIFVDNNATFLSFHYYKNNNLKTIEKVSKIAIQPGNIPSTIYIQPGNNIDTANLSFGTTMSPKGSSLTQPSSISNFGSMGSNKMIYIIIGIVILGLGYYFYKKKKSPSFGKRRR